MTHTPGPWDIYERNPPLRGGYDHSVFRADLGLDLLVCDVYGAGNARLIAAAPDLLAACKDALDRYGPNTPAGRRIRAAIAKATGEQE
jgi:hypothetical protein